jgi:hypothetical protein
MKWVTVPRVKMDRTASGWLIRRFIDKEPEFLFAERDQIDEVIAGGAHPFHNYVWTGQPRTTTGFQDLLAEYGLDKDEALVMMSHSVRAGEKAGWMDTGSQHEGLWAIANGNTLLAKDDADMIDRMMTVYDALYRYCQARVSGESGWTVD